MAGPAGGACQRGSVQGRVRLLSDQLDIQGVIASGQGDRGAPRESCSSVARRRQTGVALAGRPSAVTKRPESHASTTVAGVRATQARCGTRDRPQPSRTGSPERRTHRSDVRRFGPDRLGSARHDRSSRVHQAPRGPGTPGYRCRIGRISIGGVVRAARRWTGLHRPQSAAFARQLKRRPVGAIRRANPLWLVVVADGRLLAQPDSTV